MTLRALEAAERLAQDGIELEVIDPRTLVPFDLDTVLASVERTNRLLICHEAVARGGWAGEVAFRVMEHAFDHLDAPIARVGAADVPIPYSVPLEEAVIPGTDDIVAAARRLLHADDARPAAVRSAPATHGPAASAPDGHHVLLPRLSDTMEEGVVLRWLKHQGDRVERHDDLVEIETEKVTVTVQAEHSGTLRDVLVPDGQAAPVGSTLARIEP
jgi:2-oxoisovalerate dehydrogenase E1 component